MASLAHGYDIFFDTQTALTSADEVGIGPSVMTSTDNALTAITLPNSVLDLSRDITGFRSL
jgi:hypothetical protein